MVTTRADFWSGTTARARRFNSPLRETTATDAGWGAVAGAGASTGVAFTVSLLVATLAFDGPQLEEAKAGILAAPVGAAAVPWLVFRTIGLLSQRRRIAALLGGAEPLLDLEFAVDPE